MSIFLDLKLITAMLSWHSGGCTRTIILAFHMLQGRLQGDKLRRRARAEKDEARLIRHHRCRHLTCEGSKWSPPPFFLYLRIALPLGRSNITRHGLVFQGKRVNRALSPIARWNVCSTMQREETNQTNETTHGVDKLDGYGFTPAL